jgi:hypothetical protein
VAKQPGSRSASGSFVEELGRGRPRHRVIVDPGGGRPRLHQAPAISPPQRRQIYRYTTNPLSSPATARRWRARRQPGGSRFVQFHPTALAAGHHQLPLLTEAPRRGRCSDRRDGARLCSMRTATPSWRRATWRARLRASARGPSSLSRHPRGARRRIAQRFPPSTERQAASIRRRSHSR